MPSVGVNGREILTPAIKQHRSASIYFIIIEDITISVSNVINNFLKIWIIELPRKNLCAPHENENEVVSWPVYLLCLCLWLPELSSSFVRTTMLFSIQTLVLGSFRSKKLWDTSCPTIPAPDLYPVKLIWEQVRSSSSTAASTVHLKLTWMD